MPTHNQALRHENDALKLRVQQLEQNLAKLEQEITQDSRLNHFVKAHEEILAAKSQADLANQTKTEFLARVSHEIRTPMNAIIGLGYLLKDTPLDDQQKSYLASLNSASDSLLHIINEILDFSKIDSGKIVLDQTHFDLEQVFEKITRIFEISAAHKPIRIIFDISPNVPRFLRGDAARLSQIIGHLINNALKYAEADEVLVAVRLKQAKMRFVELDFSVIDFGVGMNQKRLAKVRECLAAKGSIEDQNGRKFGLGICSHLVSLMQGEIRVESQINEGTRIGFNAFFDHSRIGAQRLEKNLQRLSDLHILNPSQQEAMEIEQLLNNKRILVAEDNLVNQQVVRGVLKKKNVHVVVANNGVEALQAIDSAAEAFDLVLMDLEMPEMDGIEATQKIRQGNKSPHIPIVALTAQAMRGDREKCIAAGMSAYLTKPINPELLYKTVAEQIKTTLAPL